MYMTKQEPEPLRDWFEPLSAGTKRGERPPDAPVGKKNTRNGSTPPPRDLIHYEQRRPDEG